MAAANPVQSLQEEATCPICLGYFTDPVTTQCGHNFCYPCISVCSEGPGTALSCPQCRQVSPEGELRANRQLQSMVELVKQLSVRQQRHPGESLCAKHEERLKLFCKEDQQLICLICKESKDHEAHTVRPIEEAAEEYKNKLAAERKKVETEFQRLQQLRKQQEQTLRRRLQEMIKKANLDKLSADMSSLEALKTEIEKKCEQPAEDLLKDIRSTMNRCEQVVDEKSKTKYKVYVMLDEDTACDQLILSEGGRRVGRTNTRQGRPDNPKRITHNPGVLGMEGFTSGRHYWELQLLRDGYWVVGVVRETVNRKGFQLSPENGAWAVCGFNGQYHAFASPVSHLSPFLRPMKLGLYLDYEGGELSVYNADTMVALYTFTGAAFNGRVYPFFGIGISTDLRLV